MKRLVEWRVAHGDPARDRPRRTRADIRRLAAFLWMHVRPHWRLLALAIGCATVYSLASATRSYLAKGVIDLLRAPAGAGAESGSGTWDQAKLLVAVATLLAALLGASGYAKERVRQAIVLRVMISVREAVVRHVLHLSLAFFHRRRMGDLFSRMTNDVAQASQALMFLFGEIVEDALTIGACFVNCLVASPLLTLLMLLFGPAVIAPIGLFARHVRERAQQQQASVADVTESMQQMLSGVRTVKAFGAEEAEIQRFRRRNDEFLLSAFAMVRMRACANGVLEAVNNLLMPLMILCGTWLVRRGWLSPADLIWFVGALVLMYPRVSRLVRSSHMFQESIVGLERLEELLNERSYVTDAPDAVPLGPFPGDVMIAGVSFAYDEEVVLRDISIEAKAGEIIALVGPSGGGKSTLLDLIARFYDPSSGAIMINGLDIRKATRASLIANLGIVTQDPFLFNDTVLENVRYGNSKASTEEVVAACRAANIHDVIAALPQGYQTVVGERGMTLSGGEKQRITIARALLKNPRVLLLDEATSALDSENERVVQEAIERLMQARTTFVVAHRLSTVLRADRIFVIDHGMIREQGTHDELVARNGLYARLYAMQVGVKGRSGATPDVELAWEDERGRLVEREGDRPCPPGAATARST